MPQCALATPGNTTYPLLSAQFNHRWVFKNDTRSSLSTFSIFLSQIPTLFLHSKILHRKTSHHPVGIHILMHELMFFTIDDYGKLFSTFVHANRFHFSLCYTQMYTSMEFECGLRSWRRFVLIDCVLTYQAYVCGGVDCSYGCFAWIFFGRSEWAKGIELWPSGCGLCVLGQLHEVYVLWDFSKYFVWA